MVRYELMDLKMVNEETSFATTFTSAGCMRFCQKLQGYHAQVSKDFAVIFFGTASKVGVLNFMVSPKTIAQEKKIPGTWEEWFKATKFKLQNCDEFPKTEYIGVYMTLGIPRSCIKENYSKLLQVIPKYFTCEGMFHMIYQYHFRLLLHFTGKQVLDIPFFLFRSLGKMSDKVKDRPESSEI